MKLTATPRHPGSIVRTEILDPRGLSVSAAAAALGIGRPALSNFLNGNAALSGDMALRLEKAFGVGMEVLMHKQHLYDCALTRAREKQIRVGRYRGDGSPAPAPPRRRQPKATVSARGAE